MPTLIEEIEVDGTALVEERITYHLPATAYPIWNQLRKLGCIWSGPDKCWRTRDERLHEKALSLLDAHLQNSEDICEYCDFPEYHGVAPAQVSEGGAIVHPITTYRTSWETTKSIPCRKSEVAAAVPKYCWSNNYEKTTPTEVAK